MPRPARPGRGSAPPGRTGRRRCRNALARRAPPRPACCRLGWPRSCHRLLSRQRAHRRARIARRIRASPTRMADAPAATAASTSARRGDPAFHHRDTVGRDPAQPAPRSAGSTSRVSRSRAFTPITGASVASARSRSSSEWVSSRIPAPGRCGRGQHRGELVVAQARGDQQRGVGAVGARLDQLRGKHQEVLAQHRDVDAGPHGVEVE